MKSLSVFCLLLIFGLSQAQNPPKNLSNLESDFFSLEPKSQDEIIELGYEILPQTSTPEKRSRILGVMGVAYFQKNDLNKSTEFFFEAKKEAEKTNNPELIAKTYGTIAHQFIHLKLNDKAKEYLNKANDEINEMPESNTKSLLKGLSHLDRGNLEFDVKKYQLAKVEYLHANRFFHSLLGKEKQVNYHYRRSLYNIGNSYYYLNQLDSSENYLSQALELKDPKNPSLNYFIGNSLALVYQKKGWYQRAIDSLEVLLKDGQLDNPRLQAEIYLNLSQNYHHLKDAEAYQFYTEKYRQLNDSLQSAGMNAVNSAITAEQKEFALALAESDKTNRNLVKAGILVLLVLVGIIVYLIRKRRKEQKIFEELSVRVKESLQKDDLVLKRLSKEETPSRTINVEEELLLKLDKFEKSKKFTNSKLTISTLAVQLKTNTTYLSEIINSHKGKNFNSYINELRIAYICEKIYQNPEYLQYKISYWAEDAGFTSHSSFATVFKSITGISPSAFLREATKMESYKPKSV